MNEMLLDITTYLDNFFYPLFVIISALQIPALDPDSFGGVLYIFSFLAFFHDTTIFPPFFIITLDLFVLSLFASWVMSFLSWAADVLPVW